MKKMCLIISVIVLAVPAFAQEDRENWEDNRRMAVAARISPLLLGSLLNGFGVDAGFEFAPVPLASVRANIRYLGFSPANFGFVSYDEEDGTNSANARLSLIRFNLEGRWYPGGNYVQGWFLSGGLQFQRFAASASLFVDDAELSGGIGMNTWSAFVGLGHKFVFRSQHRAAFMIEPILDLGWRLASDIPSEVFAVPFTGWAMGANGLRFSVLFGVAF